MADKNYSGPAVPSQKEVDQLVIGIATDTLIVVAEATKKSVESILKKADGPFPPELIKAMEGQTNEENLSRISSAVAKAVGTSVLLSILELGVHIKDFDSAEEVAKAKDSSDTPNPESDFFSQLFANANKS